jgi:hypothetical protein
MRPALSLDSYSGPQQGELHWSGQIPINGGVRIQGGRANVGTLTNDLPRVPVAVEVVSGGATIIEPPSESNHWDRLTLRNFSGSPVADIVIHWKVAK